MKLFRLSVTSLVIRFHIIMIIIVTAGFAGHYIWGPLWFLGLLAFPIFIATLMGIEFRDILPAKKPSFGKEWQVQPRYHHRVAHH